MNIRILKMSEGELHAHWDRIEVVLGQMEIGDPRPSDFLCRAYRQGLLTFDQAMDLYEAAIGYATTDP